MTTAERLIDEIMSASRIPSEKRRREVRRELQAHMEDIAIALRANGRSEDEIERSLVERFGDPRQIARQFAWVYWRERAARHFGGFLISTTLVSVVISAAAISIQAGIMSRFSAPILDVLASRHARFEALDILATAATYIGLVSLGRFFRWPLAVLAALAAGLLVLFAATGVQAEFILFGFCNGALLRGIQVVVRHPAMRLAAALACLGVLGAIFFHPPSSMMIVTSWAIMGAAYHLMTHVAARVDRALAPRM